MEEQSTGVILARATELRLKIRSSVSTAVTAGTLPEKSGGARDDRSAGGENGGAGFSGAGSRRSEADAEEEGEEAARLLNICDALESLENQLSSLQDLQQRQRYEKEAALSEIEQSRKILVDKLTKYKGGALEVIHEASAFAGDTVQYDRDLMLPPYPSYLHPFPSGHKPASNGLPDAATNKGSKEPNESGKESSKANSGNPKNGLGSFVSIAAKSVITIVGIVSILHLTGYRPKFVRKVAALKVLNLFRKSAAGGNGSHIKCPPGKLLITENGESRCIVKERIEVPFSSVAAKPDVNYGCG